jgi:hypothetical protein
MLIFWLGYGASRLLKLPTSTRRRPR